MLMINHSTLHPGESLSYWIDSEPAPEFEALNQSIEADVCVVGAGIGGITTAYLLQKEGKRVCVLEDHEVGSGQTGRTTAHFSTALDDRYFQLERYHGQDGAKLAAESHQAALRRVEQIVKDEEINCSLKKVSGYLFCPPEESADLLNRELKAIHRAGLSDVKFVDHAPIPGFFTGTAIEFPNQIQLHPLQYLNGMVRSFVQAGGQIFTHTHVSEIHGGKEAVVKTASGFEVKCASVVVATNTPINDLFAIHTKQAPYRTYVIGAKITKGSIPEALFWDTLDPYHYVRLQQDEKDPAHDLLIVGGQDHKTGQDQNPKENYAKLETWMRKHFKDAKEVVYEWSGQVMEPVDGLAYLGHNPLDRNNVYVITGDSGNGMTHGTIGGILISDQIMKRENPWEKLYHPGRVSLRAAKNFIKENANVAAQYADWVLEGDLNDLADIPVGEGAVFRHGMKIVAAYRNSKNEVEFMSAACPHLGAAVRWNTAEKSWDCPCHGSRFDASGKVIEGPACSNLKQLGSQDRTKRGEGIPIEDLKPRPKAERKQAMDLNWSRK